MLMTTIFGFHVSEEDLDCITACDSLLRHNKTILFLKQIVMGSEKWLLCINVEQKRLWGKRNEPSPTTPKAGLHPEKAMVYLWWDWKGILYYELPLENQTINSSKYWFQLDQGKATLDESIQN